MLRIKNIVFVFMLLFMFYGCATKKVQTIKSQKIETKNVQSVKTDITKIVIRKIEAQSIKADTATVKTTIEQIKRLPSRATFSDKSGRASVSIRYMRDTIEVSATCDSLQRLVECYESENYLLKNALSIDSQQIQNKTEITKKRLNGIFIFIKWLLIGAIIGIAIGIFISKKTNWIDKIFKKVL